MIYNVSKNSKLKNRRLKTIVADLTLEAAMLKELAQGLLLTPDRRRSALEAGPPAVRRSFETRAHKVTGQPRSTQRQVAKPRVTVDAEITEILCEFARTHPRQGYRKAHRALLEAGYRVNRQGTSPVGGRSLLASERTKEQLMDSQSELITQLAPRSLGLVPSFDATFDGKALKLLNIIDEYSREYLDTLVKSFDRCRRGYFGS
jgi:hypothetical protein